MAVPLGLYYPPFGAVEYTSPIIGEAVLTGRDTGTFISIWYGLKKGFPFNEVVYIGMNSGEFKFVGPGKAVGTHNLVFCLPSQEADGDGFPDPGQAPVLALPATTTMETRLPPPR